MPKTIAQLLKTLATSQLVAVKNSLSSGKPIQKFSTRAAGEAAVGKLLPSSYEEALASLKKEGIKIAPEFTEAAPEPSPKLLLMPAAAPKAVAKAPKAAPPASGDPAPKKQVHAPMLNIRCGTCGFFAKTTPAMLGKGRLKCPIHASHGNLLTAEERGEKRGRG